jgi:hypothetical protein
MNVPSMAVELATVALVVVILFVDFLSAHGRRPLWVCYLAGTAVIFGIAIVSRGEAALLGGSYIADGLSWFEIGRAHV